MGRPRTRRSPPAIASIATTSTIFRSGAPIANTQVLILDDAGRPVPVGIRGEICAAGDGLARGYLGDAALTAERFVPHPYVAWRAASTARATSAAGRLRAIVEFLGRTDDQVKIRGFRVEPAEIEVRIREFDGVTDAIVLPFDSALRRGALARRLCHRRRRRDLRASRRRCTRDCRSTWCPRASCTSIASR